MNHFQVAVPIGSLPLQLVCISDGSIAFTRTQDFKTIVDDGAIFDNEGFSIGGESYQYNTKLFYKEIDSMLQWLIRQELIMPVLN